MNAIVAWLKPTFSTGGLGKLTFHTRDGYLLAVLLCVITGTAHAHSASSSYLQIVAEGPTLHVQWSIALRDLDYATGLDTDGDGKITWGEVRHHEADIDAYALSRLRLTADGRTCDDGPVTHLAETLGDGTYAVLRFDAQCPATPHLIGVHYSLLFDLDPLHRGLLKLVANGVPHAAALSPQLQDAIFGAAPGYASTFAEFFGTGMEHLLTGIDHMLFITMLMLPAMFRWRCGVLEPVPYFRQAFVETVKVLSAFTLAHATTLTLSVLHIVHIPQRLSEAGIALTIVITALDNIFHVLPHRRWPIAFFFGLVHGLGFATALGPLSLPPAALAVALVSFNLGLEAAQVMVAIVVLPVGFLARHTLFYPRRVVPGVSFAVGALALAWFADRAGGFGFMPF
jgi:hypothetical protein